MVNNLKVYPKINFTIKVHIVMISGMISLEGTFPGSDPPCPGLAPDILLLELSFPSLGGCQTEELINFISLETGEDKILISYVLYKPVK